MDPNTVRSFMVKSAISLFRIPMLSVQDFDALRVSIAHDAFIAQRQLDSEEPFSTSTYRSQNPGKNASDRRAFEVLAIFSPLPALGDI